MPIPSLSQQPKLMQDIEAYDPQLRINQAELKIAESKLRTQTDAQKDRFDIVMGTGINNRTSSGTTSSDTTYSVGFEYQRSMNRDGFDAQMYQAQLDHDIAEEKLKAKRQQLQYEIAALMQRLYRLQQVVKANEERLEAQRLRYQDVKQRYNEGRATIAELMMLEAELQGTELALKQQRIELSRQLATLELMRGQLWVR
jgi:outer membrane protein TolC